jgi:hypothetical protein
VETAIQASEMETTMADIDLIKTVVAIHMAGIEMAYLLHLLQKNASQHGDEMNDQTPDYPQDLHPPILLGMMREDRIVLMATDLDPEILTVITVHPQEVEVVRLL